MKSIRRVIRGAVADLTKYSPDQDRDDHGRWSSGGGLGNGGPHGVIDRGSEDDRMAASFARMQNDERLAGSYRDPKSGTYGGPRVSEAGAKHDAEIARSGAELGPHVGKPPSETGITHEHGMGIAHTHPFGNNPHEHRPFSTVADLKRDYPKWDSSELTRT